MARRDKKNIKKDFGNNIGKKKINWKILIICLIIVFAIGAIGSIFTFGETKSSWYESIKPSITPPNYVFPIVWNILFLLIALSLYYSWINANKEQKKKIGFVFGINFILNILWSVLYFKLHNPIASFLEIVILLASIITMIYAIKKINKKAGWLLVPYLLWVSFATILNYLTISPR